MAGFDVIGYGEASIDEVWRAPVGFVAGGKARATTRDRLGGGQVATALVAAARLGARCGFLGPMGDDALGEEIAHGLCDEGVEVFAAARLAGLVSRSALVLVSADGDRSVLESGGAVGARATADALATVGGSRALHVDATQPHAALALARAASDAGAIVSIDVDHLPRDAASAALVRSLVETATLCVLARGLPSLLTGEPDAVRALAALRRPLRTRALVVETRGSEGALALADGEAWLQPASEIAVVDTTACGDTFRGALLVARLEGQPDRDAVRFATRAAAYKCRDLGRRGCPTRVELEAALLDVV